MATEPSTLKAGDLEPGQSFTLSRPDDEPLGFETADVEAVWFVVRAAGSTEPIVQEEVDDWAIADEALTGTYSWQAGDTDEPGKYNMEVRVVLTGNRPITFPNDQHGRLEIISPLYAEPEV